LPGTGQANGVQESRLNELFASWAELWRPPERLPLSEWVERNFVLSEYSAQTGRIRLRGYQREPFDAFTDPRVSEIVLKVGTQLLKTLFMQAALAYAIIEDPGPALMSQPKEDDARQFSQERLSTMIRDIDGLRVRVIETKSRSVNSTLFKQFPGGTLSIVGAGAPGNAARRSIRYYFADEINKYQPTPEGNFTTLADERTSTYRHRAKRVYACSPTTADGEISIRFENSDQRLPFVACPSCDQWQTLKWAQVRVNLDLPAEDQADSALYICESCEAAWTDLERWSAAENVRWIAQRPFRGVAGFGGLNHLYSPDKTMAQMFRTFQAASRSAKQGDLEALRVFVNTNLAEDWHERGEAPEWKRLYDQREEYPLCRVPSRALFLTAGADVQKDRIEIQVVGWSRTKESWLVDYVILEGDTSRPEVWEKCSTALNQVYSHVGGFELPIIRFAIDSGYATQEVYAWAREQGPGRVAVVKGHDGGAAIVGTPSAVDVSYRGKKISRGIRVWPVNSSALKAELYGRLQLDSPTQEALAKGEKYPAGYCHFPQMSEEFFRQLTAEHLITRKTKGYRKTEWHKTRDRNEALDTRIYARAAASMFGMDRFGDLQWNSLEEQVADRSQPAIEDQMLLPLKQADEAPAVVSPSTPVAAAEPARSGTSLDRRALSVSPQRGGWIRRDREERWL